MFSIQEDNMKNNKEEIIQNFDPNGVGLNNGNFIGLPFDYDTSDIILFPVPWDVTVSYRAGTNQGPKNILEASYQLDLFLENDPYNWKKGIYFSPIPEEILSLNQQYRSLAEQHIERLENGDDVIIKDVNKINLACQTLNKWVYDETKKILEDGKKIILIGGDHSTPLGYLKSLAEKYSDFGILQIDAHCDLRNSYEGFMYSHASIFYNALQEIPNVKHITQIGIRDFCEEENNFIKNDNRVFLHTDYSIRKKLFEGISLDKIFDEILDKLPNHIYISFDIDGLNPSLCPNTGTPVPGGFHFNEIIFLIEKLKGKNKNIVGCDLCEVGGNAEWDGNVGARIIYQLMRLF